MQKWQKHCGLRVSQGYLNVLETAGREKKLQSDEMFSDDGVFSFFKALRNKHIVHDENSYSDAHVICGIDAKDVRSTSVKIFVSPIHYFIINEVKIEELSDIVNTASTWVKSRRSELEYQLEKQYSEWHRIDLENIPDLELSSLKDSDVFVRR